MFGRAVFLLIVACALARSGAAAASGDDGWAGREELGVVVDSLRVDAGVQRIELSRAPVDTVLSVIVGTVDLRADPDLRVLRDAGIVVLPRPVASSVPVVVRFRHDPSRLQGYVALRERVAVPVDAADSTSTASARPEGRRRRFDRASTGVLRIEGSKTVAVRSGSNRDATVDQGLNLSINGQLTEGISVRAEITDENLPITPEGNTEELTDLDQVSIELFGERGRILVGDFRVQERLGVFVPYERKLQGLDLVARDPRGRLEVLGGSPKGRRREIELRGREGVQGPYELMDGLRLDQTFIVAGSERVLVDGREAVRGSDRDYTIDYIRGTISFTQRLPIGPQSRIAVDFETSAAGYQRNVIGAIVDSVGVGPFRFDVAVVREGDDAQRPRDRSFDEVELRALREAGDDPDRARSSGIRSTPQGEGDYVERFTGTGERYFVAADSAGGNFEVDFLYVGDASGSYRLNGVNEVGVLDFEFVGPGLGDYEIGRALPLPEVTDVAVMGVSVGDASRGGYLRAEANLTEFDANRSSDLGDGDNQGAAWRIEGVSPRLFGRPSGDDGLRFRIEAERIEDRFRSFGRLRAPFFYEAWNLQGEARDATEDHLRGVMEFERAGRRASATWRRLSRAGIYEGQRVENRGSGPVALGLQWEHDFAETRARRVDGERDSRRRERRIRFQHGQRRVVPFVQLQGEDYRDERAMRVVGYREEGWSTGFQFGARGLVSVARENADSLAADGATWRFARDAWTARARGGLGRERTRIDADLSWRRAELPGGTAETTRLARTQFAHRSPERGLSFDLDYRIGTDQSRVLGRRVIFVGFGKGDYDVEGKVIGPGRGDYNVVYTPTDSLVASTEVAIDTRLEWRPSHDWFWGWGHVLSYQVLERSRTDDVGALVRFDPDALLRPETTVFGEQRLREEMSLLRNLRRHDLRLVFERQDVLDQRFREGPEAQRHILGEVRLETRLTGSWSLRTEAAEEKRRRTTTSQLNPLQSGYDVRDRTGAGSLRWRGGRQARAELELRFTQRKAEESPLRQEVWALAPLATVGAFSARWTVDARWAEVREENPGVVSRPFFFERPGTGRSAGILAQWGGTGSLTVSLRYQVVDEPGLDLRQDLSFETRARF